MAQRPRKVWFLGGMSGAFWRVMSAAPSIKIRLATADDIEWLALAQVDIITLEGDACDVLKERKVARMRVLQDRVLVAVDEASLARLGWLAYTFAEAVPFGVDYGNMDEPYLWVEAVFVEPESRGKGIGTFLYTEAERLARAKGISVILMDDYEVNTKSKAFHEKAGYKPWVTVWRKSVVSLDSPT